MGCGSSRAAPLHPLCAHLQSAGDSSDVETSSLEDLAEPPLMLRGPPQSPGPRAAGLQGDRPMAVTGK